MGGLFAGFCFGDPLPFIRASYKILGRGLLIRVQAPNSGHTTEENV